MRLFLILLALPCLSLAQPEIAARKFHPKITWRANSAITADFTCRGRTEHAILGTTNTAIFIAIFPNGLASRPQLLEYSARVRNPATAVIKIEPQRSGTEDFLGYKLPGFRPSKTCKGLNFSDGHGDSAHIYWNRSARRFDDWSL